MPTTPIADSNGVVNTSFLTPTGLPDGTHEILLVGDQGSIARGLFTSTNKDIDPRRWFSQKIVTRYDPIAQTFTLKESRMVGAIDIKIALIGVNNRTGMRMQIREVENGIPTSVCLGEVHIPKSSFVLNDWTRFAFNPPVPLLANNEYAMVMFTDDPDTEVAIAKQGEFTIPDLTSNAQQWVTSQPYQVGVLLVSSNASSWTVLQDSDLTFRILACKFTQTEKVVDFGVVNHADITDAMVRGFVNRPFGAADAKFEIIAPDGEFYLDVEDSPKKFLDRISGDFRVRAHLYGDAVSSPIVVPGTQLLLGDLDDVASYISLPYPADDFFTSIIVFDALRQGNSNITIYIASQRYNVDGTPVIVDNVYQYDWVQVTKQTDVLPLGDGWNEEAWEIDSQRGVGLDRVSRIKLVLSGGPTARPILTNLRIITK